MEIIQIDITLHVRSVEETMAWYTDVLGWKSGCDLRNDAGECLYGDVYVSHDPLVGFNLLKSDAPRDLAAFHPSIKVSDLNTLHQRLAGKSVRILQPPQKQHWGTNMRVVDINGFELEFWSETLE